MYIPNLECVTQYYGRLKLFYVISKCELLSSDAMLPFTVKDIQEPNKTRIY